MRTIFMQNRVWLIYPPENAVHFQGGFLRLIKFRIQFALRCIAVLFFK